MRLISIYIGLLLFHIQVFGQQSNEEPEYELVNLGRKVNSIYHESAPVLSPDGNTLYFTITNHPENTEGTDGSQDIWFTERQEDGSWAPSQHLESPFNQEEYNQVMSVSADGQEVLVRSGNSKKWEFATIRKANGVWQKPESLRISNFDAMCKGKFNGGFLSYDKKAMLLYFSEVKDSKISDLYVSFMESPGKWSTPKKIAALNTKRDEFGPYLAPDNRTLYFASNRPGGHGGADVYRTTRQDDSWFKWSKPENVGAPVNTKGFDAFYAVGQADSLVFTTRAHMSADGGHLDIYGLEKIKKVPPPVPVIRLEGMVMNQKTQEFIEATVEISSQQQILTTETTNVNEGVYATEIPEPNIYRLSVSAEGYLAKTDSIWIGEVQSDTILFKDIFLEPLEVGLSVRLNNIFFDYNKTTLRSESFEELDKVVEMLKTNENLHIEIGGHTDDRGSDDYNEQLSQGRAESVRQYLVENWIEQERVTAVGYGESQPEVPNTGEENWQINRRVEFTILKN
ncbi:OmpA family protein [Tunicatimonas pelagia]|uniref:OmpA family protein n=1 Tax=Tunicatimonas pelagia TaxID=931531 RepID=UPI002665E0AC|nr:OmpA family protein [Tunicatimonas pelagia]WKN42949.1 OmpA family protein [Tunicatimonas pelagia]